MPVVDPGLVRRVWTYFGYASTVAGAITAIYSAVGDAISKDPKIGIAGVAMAAGIALIGYFKTSRLDVPIESLPLEWRQSTNPPAAVPVAGPEVPKG